MSQLNFDPTRRIIVQKYGGSSVADAAKIGRVADRICRRRDQGADLVVVVSAMGDTTDDLIKLAEGVVGPNKAPDAREMDVLLSTGELVSSTLMAMAIRSRGYDVVSLSGQQAGIRTDSVHGSARIAEVGTDRLRKELESGKVVIVAGFQGLAETGDVTTLGRGGSDTTAVALAAALHANRCEIFTDVEGIYTTDPRLVPEARKMDEIGYEEMLEMAVLGAKMNPRSIELAAVYKVPVLVASTFSDASGTLIHDIGEKRMEVRKAVNGIAVDRNVAKLTIRGVRDVPGVAAAIFEPLAAAGVSVDIIVQNTPQAETTDMSFTTSEGDFQKARQVLERELTVKHSGIDSKTGMAKVSIVGTGMQNSPGYAARMFRALADAGVNIESVTTSEIRITCLVKREQVPAAAQALHRAFELDKP